MISSFFCLLGAYLIGSISGAFLLGKLVKNIDIRNYGSGNAGTTNAMRIMGRKLGLVTLLIDIIKGFLAMFLLHPFISEKFYCLIAVFAVLGHDYPFYMNFKGGKGVATTSGCLVWLNPKLGFASILCGIIMAITTKYASLGSISFLIFSFLVFNIFLPLSFVNRISLLFLCILGIYRHRSNINRLKIGEENKIGGF